MQHNQFLNNFILKNILQFLMILIAQNRRNHNFKRKWISNPNMFTKLIPYLTHNMNLLNNFSQDKKKLHHVFLSVLMKKRAIRRYHLKIIITGIHLLKPDKYLEVLINSIILHRMNK